jgi:hypothetical protein
VTKKWFIKCNYCDKEATVDRWSDNGHGGGGRSNYACDACDRKWPR